MMSNKIFDCIVVGGGVAGLTAGLYLSRFNCTTCMIDNNDSRALLIKKSHNFPAFPLGISGNEILNKLKAQYRTYQQPFIKSTVKNIIKNNKKYFVVNCNRLSFKSKFLILATGVVDIEPHIPNLRSAIKDGLIRHCLICDAYEASGKKILIIGDTKHCLKQAFLLRCYTDDLTVLTINNKIKWNTKEHAQIKKNGIKIINGKNCEVIIANKKIKSIKTSDGIVKFDVIYSALGVTVRSDLAIKLGAKHDKNKSLLVNNKQETSINGLYAIGDVVKGIHQMCVAASQGAIAAIDIFNKLKTSGIS